MASFTHVAQDVAFSFPEELISANCHRNNWILLFP